MVGWFAETSKRKFTSFMFSTICKTPLIKELLRRSKVFLFLLCNRINLFLLYFCIKSQVEERRAHKVVTVM